MSAARAESLYAGDVLDRQKLQFVDVKGIRTRYYHDGTGEPLVLVHGGNFGSPYCLDDWSLNLPFLAQHFEVFAVDRLGQGHTDNPETNEDYTFERMFRHFYDFVQAVGITGGYFAGHSRGALPVGWLALEYPALVKKLVIVDSDTIAPELPMFPSGSWYLDHPVPPGAPTLENVSSQLEAMAVNREHLTQDYLQRVLETALLPKTHDANEIVEGVGSRVWMESLQPKRREVIRKIEDEGFQMPTLVIWALNDKSAPFPKGQQLFERIAGKTSHAEMHVVNRSSHQVYREQPDIFNRTLRDFLLG